MRIHVNEYYGDGRKLETMALESVSDVLGKNDPELLAEMQALYPDVKLDDSGKIDLDDVYRRGDLTHANAHITIYFKVPLPGGYADLPDDELDALVDGIYSAATEAVESYGPEYVEPIASMSYTVGDDVEIVDDVVVVPIYADVEYRYEDESPELY